MFNEKVQMNYSDRVQGSTQNLQNRFILAFKLTSSFYCYFLKDLFSNLMDRYKKETILNLNSK